MLCIDVASSCVAVRGGQPAVRGRGVSQRPRRGEQPLVPAALKQAVVEPLVHAEPPRGRAAVRPGLRGAGQPVLGGSDAGLPVQPAALHRHSQDQAFPGDPRVGRLVEVRLAQRSDAATLPRDHHCKALLREPNQGLPHDGRTDAVALGQLRQPQTVTGAEDAGPALVVNRRGDRESQRSRHARRLTDSRLYGNISRVVPPAVSGD